MGAWPVDERTTGERRPRPKRWLLLALVSFVAIFVVAGLAPEFEEGEDPTGPWAAAFVITSIGTFVGLAGAVAAAIRARRYREQQPPEDGDATRAGRPGLYLALGGLGLIVVTMMVRQAVAHPAPGDGLDVVSGLSATIGVCVVIAGLSYWGMLWGRRVAERRMARNLEGHDRIAPTDEEEASLQLVFARMAARAVNPAGRTYWGAAAGNPIDVRVAERTLPLDPATVRASGVDAFDALGGEVLDAREDLVRGWWFGGGSLNGNPVVVTLSFEPDGLGGTHVTARSAVRFYLSNQDLAQEGLDLMLASLDRGGSTHVAADAAPLRPDEPESTAGDASPTAQENRVAPSGAAARRALGRSDLPAIVAAAVLALALFTGIGAVRDAVSYTRYGEGTTGTVLEVHPHEGYRSYGAEVLVRYEAAGETYTGQASNHWSSDIHPGQQIDLTYDARNPTRVTATPLFYLYFRGLFPLLFLVVLAAFTLRRARRRTREATPSPIGPSVGYGSAGSTSRSSRPARRAT